MYVLVLTVILSCVLFAWSRLRRRNRSPPALPGALPLIGHALQTIGDRKHLWKFLKRTQAFCLSKGGVIEFWLGPHSIYIITDPEDALTVANTCLNKPYPYYFAKDFLDRGLVTLDAVEWKIHRKLLNPTFNQPVLYTYLNEANVQARCLIISQFDSQAGKGPFVPIKHFTKYSLAFVTRNVLGLNTKDQIRIDTEYSEGISDLFDLYAARFQYVWLHLPFIYHFSAIKRKEIQITTKLKNIINPVIQKRKAELKANKNLSINADSIPDKIKPVLDQMLEMAENQGAFTDREIREHMDTLVTAATETTTVALTNTMIVLGSYQDVQERVFNELQEVFHNKDDDVTKENVQKLVYLEAVIKETMRLYPVTLIAGRKIEKDVILKDCTLRSGSSCILGLFGLSRHSAWGADVEQFRPERWLDPDTLPKHPGVFTSFSIGRRNCIAKLYTIMVMKTVLAHILRRYHVTADVSKLVCEFTIVSAPIEGNEIALTFRK